MFKTRFFFITFAILTAQACSHHVYKSPDAEKRAATHDKVAVLPPRVTIAPVKKVSPEALQKQAETESIIFQHEMHDWLLRRKMQRDFTAEIQDVETTNAKLEAIGYFENPRMAPEVLCEQLGVDAVLGSNFSLSRPMSEGAAVALGVVFGVWGPTAQAHASMDLFDRSSKHIIYSYNNDVSGTVGSTHAELVDWLMSKASKKSPYQRPK